MKTWVEIIDGQYIHHTKVNDFTVTTRVASEGETLAYNAKKAVEEDVANAHTALDDMSRELDKVRDDAESACEPFKQRIAVLESEKLGLQDEKNTLASENQALREENSGHLDTITDLKGQFDKLSKDVQGRAAGRSHAPAADPVVDASLTVDAPDANPLSPTPPPEFSAPIANTGGEGEEEFSRAQADAVAESKIGEPADIIGTEPNTNPKGGE